MNPVDPRTAVLTAEQAYRLMVDNPRDVIYRSTADNTFEWVSSSVTDVLGWLPEEIIGTSIDAFVHDDDLPSVRAFRAALRQGVSLHEIHSSPVPPLRVRTREGDYHWASIIAVLLISESGVPEGIVGRMRDVHDLTVAQAEIRASRELAQNAFDKLLDPLLVMRPIRDEAGAIVDFEYLDANPAACQYNGMSYEAMIGTTLLQVNPGNVENGQFAMIVRAFETGEPLMLDDHPYEQELLDGERRYYDLRVARAGDVLIYTWRDVTDRMRAEREIAEREDLYRLVTEDVTDAVVRFDDHGHITWVSPSFEMLTGLSAHDVIGLSGLELLSSDHPTASDQVPPIDGDVPTITRHAITRADGSTRWVDATYRPFVRHDNTVDGHVSVLRDVTMTVEAEARRDHDLRHDALTGLANRHQAVVRIERALDELGGPRRFIALLGVGIDRLTIVNQALSYAAGDLVLEAVSARIASAVGDPDLVARVAGDEFVVLLTELRSPSDAAAWAERLCAAARGDVITHDQSLAPTVSIGVAIGERDSSAEDLLRKASLAVRQAKQSGRDRWQFVDPALATEARRRLEMEALMRQALADGEVNAWFQPVVALADRRLCGYEALARIQTPGEAPIPPAEFLGIAEVTRQIIDLDLAVLAQALDLATVSTVEHLAVNVSSPSLGSGEYAERFTQGVLRAGVNPRRIRLEVTETALLGMAPAIIESMRTISELGSTWYVDDFGTGFSSISHLRDLPVRGLKLDRSFVAGMRNGDRTCIKLAQGLIGLADGLGLDTVAEGIETEFEAGALLGQGWNLGQGWLFGTPTERATIGV